MNAPSSTLSSQTRPALSAVLDDDTPPHTQADPLCVYGRTFDGHREALRLGKSSDSLRPDEHRLLLLFTGLTPLNVLTPPTSGIEDPVAAATKLLQAGLIELVPQEEHLSAEAWQPRQPKWWS